MKTPCGCCDGIQLVTPVTAMNRPGLPEISYRVGTYATFLESMLARLSSAGPIDTGDAYIPDALSPLTGLRVRQPDDASIALLDAWAIMADVLTFYQERIANEGYLRTAIERRSVLELARLLGYKPRPGVAASVYMAFTLQSGFDVDIPATTAAKTSPGPGELPQTFETSAPIYARSAWNELVPRRTRPQRITEQNANEIGTLYFAGVATRLKQNDRLLLVFGNDSGKQFMRRVKTVQEDHDNKRTEVTLQVEAFSAAQFALEMQGVLQDQLKICKDLADVQSVKDLEDALQQSNPLSKLSAAVLKTTDDLTKQAVESQASVKDLTLVHDASATLSTGLSTFLGKNHAALAANTGGVVTAFGTQEMKATNVAAALEEFTDLIPAGGAGSAAALSPIVDALLTADQTLTLVAAPGFTALDAEMTKLHEKNNWKTPVTELPVKIKDAVESIKGLVTAALAVPPNPVKDKDLAVILTQIQSALNALGPLATPADQMAVIEDAAANLKGKTSTALKSNLNSINDEFVRIHNDVVAARLDQASNALGTHSELNPPQDVLDQLKTVHDTMKTLGNKLPAVSLVSQRDAINDAMSTIKSIPTFGLNLLPKRLKELTDALTAAPGTVVQTDLKTLLDATPIPAVADAKAKGHAAAITAAVQQVETAPNFFAAITNASAAAGKLDSETTAMRDEIQSAQSDKGCFTAAVTALAAEQARFADHFKKLFQDISSRYRTTLPEGPDRQVGIDMLDLLDKTLRPGAVTLADLAAAMDDVLKQIDNKVSALPVTDVQLRQWFGDLESDLKTQLQAIEENQSQPPPPDKVGKTAFLQLKEIAANLLHPSTPGKPAAPDLKTAFGAGSDAVARSLVVMKPGLGDQLLQGWGNITVDLPVVEVYAFRVRSSPFGYNAPRTKITKVTVVRPDPNGAGGGQTFEVVDNGDPGLEEDPKLVSLEAAFDQVVPDSWVSIQRPGLQPVFAKASEANSGIGIVRYGMTGKTTGLSLASAADPKKPVNWFETGKLTFPDLRQTTVWAQAELLELAEIPLTDPIGPANASPAPGSGGDLVELDGYFDGLEVGRFVALTGERTDVAGVSASELAQIAAIEQLLDPTLPGDTLHTQLQFTVALRHQYKRDTVKINANVAHATHGETQKEVLGSGHGSVRFQAFKLSKPPLTYLSEPTPSGAESTLQVRVNDILWHEADNLAALSSNDRKYIIDIQDDGTTKVTFGDGIHGVRLPTGVENIRAVYRSGIGKGGNVIPKKISMIPSPPLGVTSVSNPAPATGGADAETRDQARRNAPVAVLALDRLVSVRDYADFARTYAGIAKANASLHAGTVTVTIAGIDDIPIDPASDLFHNLLASIEEFGDPHQAVTLQVRKLKILVLQTEIAIDPDYDFKVVSSQISAALLVEFGFDRQELGEAVILSQVISVIQGVAGVLIVDVEHFDAIPEIKDEDPDPQEIINFIGKLHKPKQAVSMLANEIGYFSPDLPETIVLKQIVPKGSA